LALLAQFFQAEENRLSYRNVLVAEEEGHIVGVIVVYHGRDAARLDLPIIERLQRLYSNPSISLDKEADEDEFYIDSLSVSSQYAGRGIGTALIEAAEQRARQLQYNKIALNVDEENERAHRLYNHLGYQEDKIIYLYSHLHHHLVKYLL
jgi:ribosomal protein S18 acetylase RimI-like enzyme